MFFSFFIGQKRQESVAFLIQIAIRRNAEGTGSGTLWNYLSYILRKNIIALVLSYRVNHYNTIVILSNIKEEQKEKYLSLIRRPRIATKM